MLEKPYPLTFITVLDKDNEVVWEYVDEDLGKKAYKENVLEYILKKTNNNPQAKIFEPTIVTASNEDEDDKVIPANYTLPDDGAMFDLWEEFSPMDEIDEYHDLYNPKY